MDDDMDLGGFLSIIDTIFYGRVSYEIDLWTKWKTDNPTIALSSIQGYLHWKAEYLINLMYGVSSMGNIISYR